jgi:mono/diheme cytochrome c family protein
MRVVFVICFFGISFLLYSQTLDKASFERGKKVYQTTCLACHQSEGQGVPRMFPTLSKTDWVLGNKQRLIKVVKKGLKGGEVTIDGDRFSSPMPAQVQLNDQQVADVLTYVRNSFGNKASGITLAEVKAIK